MIRRTPDTTGNLSRDSITPTNELYNYNNTQEANTEEIVDIQGPDIDLDNITDEIAQTSSANAGVAREDIDLTGSRNVDVGDRFEDTRKEIQVKTSRDEHADRVSIENQEDAEQVNTDLVEREVDADGMRWSRNVNEVNDDIVEGMIEEGIMQVTLDGLNDLEEDTVQYPANLASNR